MKSIYHQHLSKISLSVKGLVDSPNDVLAEILIEDAINKIKEEFTTKHGITLNFTENAINLILDKSKKQNINSFDFCYSMLTDYEYGLKLIGESSFTVTEDVVNNHRKFLG